jgi:uncharacterized membrane protein
MESFIEVLIIVHAAFGGIALVAGLIAMSAKKGLKVHRKSGMVFFYTMLISALTAMVVSLLPNHESPFLFAVGIFSLFFVLTGRRALRFKFKNPNLSIDRAISVVMLVTGILMVSLPIIVSSQINIVLTVFGIVGIIFAIRNLMAYRNTEKLKANWLKMHLGNMMGGYISAFTAFVVVNQFFPPLINWLGPGFIGGFFISYWIRKVRKAEEVKKSVG